MEDVEEPVKLPVPATASLTLQWGIFIVRRHWMLVLAYALVPFAVLLAQQRFFLFSFTVGRNFDPLPFVSLFGTLQLYAVSQVFLALVTHNEVLRCATGFDAATMGRGGSRVLGYILDVLLVVVGVFVVMIGVMMVAGWLFGLGTRRSAGPNGLMVVAFLALWLSAVLGINRLMLRLPTRALGQPLPWRDVWRLGRGNSWRLLGGALLVSAAVSFAIGMTMLPLPLFFMPHVLPLPPTGEATMMPPMPFPADEAVFLMEGMSAFLIGVGYLASTIVLCAYLSLAYLHLREGKAEPEHLPGP